MSIIAVAIFIKVFVIKNPEDKPVAPVVGVDLAEIAFKSQEEVEAILGKGDLLSYWTDIEAGCDSCPKVSYREGKVEIIFINEISDQITLSELSKIKFDDRAILGALGLNKVIKPAFEDGGMKRWDNYEKYTQISAFSKQDHVDSILIKCKSE